MSKDRNIDDAELAKISGAGDLEIAKNDGGSGGGATDPDELDRQDPGGGGGTNVEGTAGGGTGDVEFGE